MPRPILPETQIHSAIQAKIAGHQSAIVAQVQAAVAAHPVVVVGMGMNPFPKKARQALDAAGIAHHDIDFGNYLNQWRERNALKLWTGWPTFPLVFIKGTLVGGATDLQKLLDSGEAKRLLSQAE